MTDEVEILKTIHRMLSEGLPAEVFPRVDDDRQAGEIIARLRGAGDDLRQKLIIAGFTLAPVEHNGVSQDCETCMYYLVRRRFCALPELNLPAEPEWSCRLWRI